MQHNSIQPNTPNGWKRVELGNISDITNGKANTQDAVVGGEYPLFDRSVSIKASDKYLFDRTAVILPGEGAEFVPRYYSGKFDLHQRVYAIFPTEEVYPPYLFQYLYANRSIFAQNAVGSTVKSLRLPIIQKVPVLLPTYKEQEKIAEILTNVDEGIQKTDEIIVATEKLKNGLMQQFFTRGIGHTKFKKTKIGDVPESWSVVAVKDAPIQFIDGDRGTNYPKLSEFSTNEYCLFLNNKNIKEDRFLFADTQFITREKDESLRKGKLHRHDVVLTTRGTVGNVAYYGEDVSFDNIRINSGMILLRASGDLSSKYLYHLMKSPLLKKRYGEVVSGSAQPQLPIRSLEQIHIPIPPKEEQERIIKMSEAMDDKLEINHKLKAKLTLLKKGLTQDLLSGKVRIINNLT